MYQRAILTLTITALLGAMAACSKRTAAATQQTILTFDSSASDEQALAAVDEMITALGGAEAWGNVKEISWEVKRSVNGDQKEHFKHNWDLWNGRHRFRTPLPMAEGQREPDWLIAMYDLFKREAGFVASSKNPSLRASPESSKRALADAYRIWLRDAYHISMFHKLRDPGVKLTYAGERKDFFGTCMNTCIDIKVSFAPEIGTDVYHVLISKDTKLPEVVEKDDRGKKMALQVIDWVDAGGLKFPKSYKNMGVDEVFAFSDLKIGNPSNDTYQPTIR